MGRSQETFGKKEREKKKAKKRKEKEEAKLARKEEGKSSWDDMIAYVDENGMIVDTPPDPTAKKKIKAEDIVLGIPQKDESDEDPIRTGTVSFFNHDKGYGFIKDADNGDSMFVHINNVLEEIAEGNKVTFEVQPGLKGPEAAKVKVVR
ncbi:MAG: cold shock domain-containing protein [Flavobacteriales bacterium]|nr:cold shock domain-containing protein [Flavobacteriales bacterium]